LTAAITSLFSACSDSRNSAPDDDIDETALVSDEKKPAPAPAVGVGVDAEVVDRWAAGEACEREALLEEEEEAEALVGADSSGSSSSAKNEVTELKKDIACAQGGVIQTDRSSSISWLPPAGRPAAAAVPAEARQPCLDAWPVHSSLASSLSTCPTTILSIALVSIFVIFSRDKT
jgi:hypothetical protein